MLQKKLIISVISILMLISLMPREAEASGEERFGGGGRYETANIISKAGWKAGAEEVVLARGDDFADALASTPFAAKINGPILLTTGDSLKGSTAQEIKRLNASKVWIVGGMNAISDKVASQLRSMNLKVERLAGKDRIRTSIAIANKLGSSHGTAIVVNRDQFPDAIAIAPYAAQKKIPIILSERNGLNSYNSNFLKKVNKTYLIGGEAVLSNSLLKKVRNGERVAGGNRHVTSVRIAEKFFSSSSMPFIATGEKFADGLTGSVLAAKRNQPILLVKQNSVDNTVKRFIQNNDVKNYTVLGGDQAVDSSIGLKLHAPQFDRNSEWLKLVNKEKHLSSSYVPKNLTIPNVRFPFSGYDQKKNLRSVPAKALENMFAAAKRDGSTLYAQSGYRSYQRQKTLFDYYKRHYGEAAANRFSARPGQSEHQTGLAMDVTSASVGYDLVESFGDTKEGKWVKNNAWQYGFIVRYPKGAESITGYQYEPWHLRYIGVEHAKYITQNHLTLEEYLE
ncbi:cell wall-binding repeat-containing protein [Rossellomorea aquimaris]|uniref:cell wall-binding repeat-containing protein n=1 Tax=Rossellomorea TaxID=2837508 RepID=UPI0016538216|nr:cell wall-binding repeat-containing protein [Rossellomorea aquimaris]